MNRSGRAWYAAMLARMDAAALTAEETDPQRDVDALEPPAVISEALASDGDPLSRASEPSQAAS